MKVLMTFNHDLLPDLAQEFILMFEDDATKKDIIAEFNESLLDFAFSIEQDYMDLTGIQLKTREEQEEFASYLTGIWCVLSDEMMDTYIENSGEDLQEAIDLTNDVITFSTDEDGNLIVYAQPWESEDENDWCLEDSTYEEDEDF